MQAAGLVDVLDSTSSEMTVFAPTDDAFAALADALHMTPEELLAESNLLSVVRVDCLPAWLTVSVAAPVCICLLQILSCMA